jgi:hypothetical protein
MAINFLNNISLNKNQLEQARIENLAIDPASGVSGQIYFNTVSNVLKIYNGAIWKEVGGGVITVDTANSTFINLVDSGTAVDPILTASLSATGTASSSTFLRGDNTWAATPDTNTTYTLSAVDSPSNYANIVLTDSNSVIDSVTIHGVTNETTVDASGNIIYVGLPDNVTITSDLTVGDNLTLTSGNLSVTGTGSFTGEVTVSTATSGTSAPNLAQVQLLVAGVGVFQGSYNAATNTPALEGASNVALDQGDYFVVSVSGSFLGEALEPGDFIFANNAIAANSSPTLSDYTVVQADDNVAGTGATDGATQKGVSGFDSTHFTATSNGWIQLKPQANANGALVSLNNTAPSTRVEAGGLTTFTVDVTNPAVFGAGALGERVKVEVTEGAAPFQTVYADVTRSGSGTLSVIFTDSVAIDAYQVLLTYV